MLFDAGISLNPAIDLGQVCHSFFFSFCYAPCVNFFVVVFFFFLFFLFFSSLFRRKEDLCKDMETF